MRRSEAAEQYKWNTKDVFESDGAWEEAFEELSRLPDVSPFRGRLGEASQAAAYFTLAEEYEKKLMRLYLYAFLRHDEDIRTAKYNDYLAKIMRLLTAWEAENAFAAAELSALSEEALSALAADPRLSSRDAMLRRLITLKKHILSEKEEKLLASAAEPLGAISDAFDMLNDAELGLPVIEHEGMRTKLTHGLYAVILSGDDRAARKKVFKKYYKAFGNISHTLATTYYGNVKKDIFYKDARGYGSCLEMALAEEEVPRAVYETLVSAVEAHAPLMHRYMAVRKRALGLSEMHMYDLHVPLVENAELRLSFEEAFSLAEKGLAPLGEEYLSLFRRGREERWIDVCETEGKRGGAYSIGIYGVHPYVLLNYQPTTHDVFTIAHEMGHALHSYFSNGAQPYPKADYKIFVAEVASTVNEVLLLKYLLKTTSDQKLKKYLYNYFMDMIRTTLFRQTQFARFEQEAHAMAERGEPLNKENLSGLYYALNKRYYGEAVTHDQEIALEWARIPHFYRSFYVYKYATGITAALAIAEKIASEGASAAERYFTFLKGGCSADPVSLLQGAGADLTKKETFEAAMREFESALNAFEALCR